MRPVDAPQAKGGVADSTTRNVQDLLGNIKNEGAAPRVADSATSNNRADAGPPIAGIDAEIAQSIDGWRIPSDPGNLRADAAVTAARIIREAGGPSAVQPHTIAGLRAAVAAAHGLSDPVAAKVVERTRRALAMQEGEKNTRAEMETQGVADASVPPVGTVGDPRVPKLTPAGRMVEEGLRQERIPDTSTGDSAPTTRVQRVGVADSATRGTFGERLNIPPMADRYFGVTDTNKAQAQFQF